MADNDESTRGPVPPYGPAIWDAAKRGDLQEMEHIADAARIAIAKGAKDESVQFGTEASSAAGHFKEVAAHEVAEVRSALTELEGKIAALRGQQKQPPPAAGDTPQQ